MAEAIDGGILRGAEFRLEATHGILALARGLVFTMTHLALCQQLGSKASRGLYR